MSASMYTRLPSKFDFNAYYLNQAAGGPSFPIYRARQHGGSFLSPLIKKHGIPFMKWLGKQAASLASGLGNQYLEKGSLNKEDVKSMLKSQGKKAAQSALDKIKQQVGSGPTMNFRRDGRLRTLVPVATNNKSGVIAPIHGIRPPLQFELAHMTGSPTVSSPIMRTRRRSTKMKKKKKEGSTRSKPNKSSKARKGGKQTKRKKATTPKPYKSSKVKRNQKKGLNPGLAAFLEKKKANKESTIFG